jgi:hypothetical protein
MKTILVILGDITLLHDRAVVRQINQVLIVPQNNAEQIAEQSMEDNGHLAYLIPSMYQFPIEWNETKN